ncbi:MAG: hypothetical protein KDH96_08565, partial [Candidatus Riesia sp.]|nr:hypothetical protein [Candidatus Riesia sp.]
MASIKDFIKSKIKRFSDEFLRPSTPVSRAASILPPVAGARGAYQLSQAPVVQDTVRSFGNTIKDAVEPLAQGLVSLDPVSRKMREDADRTRLEAARKLTERAARESNPATKKRLLTLSQQITSQPTAAQQYADTLPSNKDVLTSGAKTLGLTLSGGLGVPGLTALGGFNAALAAPKGLRQEGESYGEALGRGFGESLPIAGLAAGVTNPIISKFAPKAAVGSRIGQGVLNVGEGIGLDQSTGRPTTPASVGVDFLLGAASPGFDRPRGVELPNKVNFTLDRNTMDELIQAEDILLNGADKYIDARRTFPDPISRQRAVSNAQAQALETIERLSAKYLPDKTLDRVAGDPKKTIKALVDLSSKNKLANVPGMGFVQGSKQFPEIEQEFAVRKAAEQPELPFLDTTQQAKDIADIQAIAGDAGQSGGFKGVAQDIKGAFRKWVNERQATKIEGFAKRKEFADLDSRGFQGILDFQAGKRDRRTKQLQKFFDQKFKDLEKSGIPIDYRTDYLPQLWADPEDVVRQAFEGRKLGGKPSFTMERVFEDYAEGIQAGLTPKFQNLSDLAGWYESRANKALADQNFFKFLVDDNLIQPKTKAPNGWVTLDPDRFPIRKVTTDEGQFTGLYSAPPELGGLINNYLRQPDGTLTNIANYASRVKNVVLSAGIPKTALNFHGVNILARNTLAAKNPVSAFVKGMYYLVRPGAAENVLLKNLDDAKFAARHGLTLSTEGHQLNEALDMANKSLGNRAYDKVAKFTSVFSGEKELFEQVIPALKLSHFEEVRADLLKRGLDETTA